MLSERLDRVLSQIDTLNRQDPSTELLDGVPQPQEFVYSQRLTGWVLRLDPDASEILRIAARGQHVQRWTIPRSRYEMTRRGYLRWRETLKVFHAKMVTDLMREAGYGDEELETVRQIILKKHLSDPDTQTMEDALCLVFLQTQFGDLRRKTDEVKMREVIRKTWQKMSTTARSRALVRVQPGPAACRIPLQSNQRPHLRRLLQPHTQPTLTAVELTNQH